MMMGIKFTATPEMEGAWLVVFIQPVDRSSMDSGSGSWGMGARVRSEQWHKVQLLYRYPPSQAVDSSRPLTGPELSLATPRVGHSPTLICPFGFGCNAG